MHASRWVRWSAAVTLLGSGAVMATDFTVDLPGTDAVDDAPGDGVCHVAGALPGAPACTLRAAIMETNALPGTDRIELPFGSHVILALPGRDEDAAATGDLDITEDVTLTTPSPPSSMSELATIDAGGLDRVLQIDSPGTGTRLIGLRLTGGAADSATSNLGGGLLSNAPSLLIEDSVIDGNTANAGGAIMTLGSLDIRRSRIHDNTTTDLGFTNPLGCAIKDRDGSPPAGTTIRISRSTIDHNTCPSNGSAIQVRTDLTIENSTLSDNTAQSAVNVYQANATLNHVTLSGNEVGYHITSVDGSAVSQIRNSILTGSGLYAACQIGNAMTDHRWTLADDSSCQLSSGPGNLPDTDPQLGSLAARYSLLPARQPAAGSPAIDAADPDMASAGGSCLAEDEDGLARPVDGNGDGSAQCDIGAIELDDVIFSDSFESP